MSIPDFQSLMRPVLEYLADGEEHANQESLAALADRLNLIDTERKELLPSGKTTVFTNRVAWAKSHLKRAELIDSPSRGVYIITKRGSEFLRKHRGPINLRVLNQFPEHRAFKSQPKPRKSARRSESLGESTGSMTPEEYIESGYQQVRAALSTELLERIKECPAEFFERLVIEVLLAIGYGGSRQEAGRAVGKSGDGGIDGLIKEDRLGLDVIYIQAKKWEGVVGRPEVQKFAGALQGRRARKGIFISTSSFTREAIAYADSIENKIVLIGGEELVSYMIDHNIGVTPMAMYELKRIDLDYFTGE